MKTKSIAMATYQERLEAAKTKLQKIYPDATIEQTIDDNGNAIWRTNIPGVKIIESMNVNALEIVVENLRQAYRAKLGVKRN
ncbi:MAG: hypothetical protein SOY17_10020 [Evtepia sp.]|nr:hypothetical protein [Evtepia sp.]